MFDCLSQVEIQGFLTAAMQSSSSPDFVVKNISYLERILEFDAASCEAALGNFGERLYEVVQGLDFEHPEVLSGVFLSNLKSTEAVFESLTQFIKLCQLAKEHELTAMTPVLSKCIAKTILPEVKLGLDYLKNKQQFVRLFKAAKDRLALRQTRQVRPIEINRKIDAIWDTVPNIVSYIRFGNYCKEELEKLTRRAEVFRKFRMNSMADETNASIEDLKNIAEYQYFGFQRVPATIVALSLGKLHQCHYYDNCVKMPNIGLPLKSKDLRYMPMVYPFHEMEVVPPQMQCVLEHLEAFPEAGNKPIFDHFSVIVPGVDCERTIEFSNHTESFSDEFVAKKSLDAHLIKKNNILPALLGEKDGKCYFICFWN